MRDKGEPQAEFAQKQVLKDQLEEIARKLKEMKQVSYLLRYKIKTYDEHIAKFNVIQAEVAHPL